MYLSTWEGYIWVEPDIWYEIKFLLLILQLNVCLFITFLNGYETYLGWSEKIYKMSDFSIKVGFGVSDWITIPSSGTLQFILII